MPHLTTSPRPQSQDELPSPESLEDRPVVPHSHVLARLPPHGDTLSVT